MGISLWVFVVNALHLPTETRSSGIGFREPRARWLPHDLAARRLPRIRRGEEVGWRAPIAHSRGWLIDRSLQASVFLTFLDLQCRRGDIVICATGTEGYALNYTPHCVRGRTVVCVWGEGVVSVSMALSHRDSCQCQLPCPLLLLYPFFIGTFCCCTNTVL